MSEMHFLPRPGATEEDDGVLFTVGFDGPREQSYLLVLDAMTFTPINKVKVSEGWLPRYFLSLNFSGPLMPFLKAKFTFSPERKKGMVGIQHFYIRSNPEVLGVLELGVQHLRHLPLSPSTIIEQKQTDTYISII